jgi:hypothetical protein
VTLGTTICRFSRRIFTWSITKLRAYLTLEIPFLPERVHTNPDCQICHEYSFDYAMVNLHRSWIHPLFSIECGQGVRLSQPGSFKCVQLVHPGWNIILDEGLNYIACLGCFWSLIHRFTDSNWCRWSLEWLYQRW